MGFCIYQAVFAVYTRMCLQGAGGMLGAVVAFYVVLQPLPSGALIRNPTVVWPLARAEEAWLAWESYNANHTASQLVERTFVYNTLPGLGELHSALDIPAAEPA